MILVIVALQLFCLWVHHVLVVHVLHFERLAADERGGGRVGGGGGLLHHLPPHGQQPQVAVVGAAVRLPPPRPRADADAATAAVAAAAAVLLGPSPVLAYHSSQRLGPAAVLQPLQ